VSACLEHDHRLLDAILTDVEAFVQDRALDVAAEYFSMFRGRLEAHIEAEEALLFPQFESGCSCHGPTSVMRREHAEIRRLLQALALALSRAEKNSEVPGQLAELTHLLDSHNVKEERVLYPEIDARLRTSGELNDLLIRLEAFLTQARERTAR
jgi:iron-sulfur cluster repair protein YtfE (RIC family)